MASSDTTLEDIKLKLSEIRKSQEMLEQIIEKELAKLVCEAANKPEEDFSKLLKNSTPTDQEQLQKLKTEFSGTGKNSPPGRSS